MDYRGSLDMYKGPMDLLLYLIRENEVDIYDIPVAEITDQYMKYLEVLELIDPNVVGDFLVLAATLTEIKSKMLLPPSQQEGEEGTPEDPRMELVRQLLEYKRYKEMAAELGELADVQARRFARPTTAAPEGGEPADVDLAEINVWDLFRSFNRLMKATLGGLPRTIVDSDVPVQQHMEMIVRMLRAQGIITFLSVFERCKDRVQAVGAFIAVLELVRRSVISIEQTSDQDDIRIRMRDEERLGTVLEELRQPGGELVPTEAVPEPPARTEEEPPRDVAMPTLLAGRSVTVLATRWENCLLFRDESAQLEMFIDFGFHAGSLDRVEGTLAQLSTTLPEVNVILMTHLHADHYDPQGLAELVRRRTSAGAGPLRFYVHRDEPEQNRPQGPGVQVIVFGDEPFEIRGLSGSLTVQPVRVTHSAGTCAFRIGEDYIGADSSLKEVFSDRVLDVLGASGTDPVKRMFLDMEALDVESIEKAEISPERRTIMLTQHGIATDLVAAMERPELKKFFEQLEQLTPLHVTPEVNDATGVANARVIAEARDRLGFSFHVPVVSAGFQESDDDLDLDFSDDEDASPPEPTSRPEDDADTQ